jgi:uncharacterized membrane protein YozB (DUF420 family)
MFSHAALNAFLNGTSGILLACGYTAIHKGKVQIHKRFMISAVCSVYGFLVFLSAVPLPRWPRPISRTRLDPPVYFVLLTSHTILAIVIVPLILITLRRAFLERFDKHRIIARWTLPLWFYVCVTGVIVYLMVYQIYAP